MTLVSKLKSLLGLSGAESRSGDDTSVTTEREPEPSTASEDAVKGTDESESDDVDEPVATETEAAGSTESIVDEEEATEDAVGAAEPAEAAGPESEDVTTDVDETDVEEGEASDDEGVDVEEIRGIGPAYAERLAEIDITTVAQLAAADPDDIAERTTVGASRAEDWVERAKEYDPDGE